MLIRSVAQVPAMIVVQKGGDDVNASNGYEARWRRKSDRGDNEVYVPAK